MKFFIYCFLFFYFYSFSNLAEEYKEFTIKGTGKLVRNETLKFPNGGMFVSFKHEGGFETSIGKYGVYECSGSILYSNQSTLEKMFFACEFKDQDGDVIITMGKRKKGSDIDRAVGQTNLVSGNGFWKKFIGYTCTYSVVYVEEIVFSPGNCRK